MRAALIGVLGGYQSLSDDESCERPVNRLAAVGAAQITQGQRDAATLHDKRVEMGERGKSLDRAAAYAALGVDLLRFKGANVSRARPDVEDQLAAILGWKSKGLKLTVRQCLLVARQAVMEQTIDYCPRCLGAMKVPDHDQKGLQGSQPMKPCPPAPEGCDGTGKRRYSDAERAELLGPGFDAALSEAHEILSRAEDSAVSAGKRLLERW